MTRAIQPQSEQLQASLFDYLDGFQAYDDGATDSGIHDDAKRAELKTYLLSLPEDELDSVLVEFVRRKRMREMAGIKNAVRWLEEYLSIDF